MKLRNTTILASTLLSAAAAAHKNWTNYQDKIAPYRPQALRQEITAKGFHDQAAKFLRGEA